ncbi:MAG: PQ-loop domain-containing transporter [Oscillospiraceae bacterium]|nr:PQ-loop domain-containing transporter [Oscillospiraceae bacterium]
MSEILEILMIVSFGVSWPLNVIKSYKARTTKGKSLSFLCLIFLGYIAGISSKFVNEAYMASFSEKWYVLFFYVLNLIMVGIDLILYFRNKRLDQKFEKNS